ncbi:dihydroxyacetone kinase subunit DhaL [Pseudonocardia sp. MH-G8]|uniref:dihydroxyacetone kinase subunit DhaL n=1 Tax=Pseudonocardia sp. MH-G8 TaxID=1854588 RepID=UPI000BA07B6F|nr:dihydroxyacetone kinase subunit DhaL [Pseudonocardia sp. MH-G8]OZM75679.1 dihydroxyacetone kinase subunit L [Pseudonocardia sp. MH-G8]
MTTPTVLTGTDVRAWVTAFAAAVAEHHHVLTEADRLAGDGDYGDNLRAALRRVAVALEESGATDPAGVLTAVSQGFLGTGGTSGPLFGMWFRELARAVGEELSTAQLAVGACRAVATVQRLGHAEVGHKTMVDAMAPAAAALEQAAADGVDPAAALALAGSAARAGAESTRELLARRGRASYVGQRAVGVVDPGAVTVALFFEAGAAA